MVASMSKIHEIVSKEPHHLHDFFVKADADAVHRDLEDRLQALSNDEVSGAESFEGSGRIVRESLLWLVLAAAVYVATWLMATN